MEDDGRCVAARGKTMFIRWAYGQMDKAPDYGSGDSRFDPWYARSFVCSPALGSFFCLSAAAIIDDVVVVVAIAVLRSIGGSSSKPAVITLNSQLSVLSSQFSVLTCAVGSVLAGASVISSNYIQTYAARK
ncbi:hypothetical protein GQ42DRAFT_29337 [Ramicandelaber brevisporus]|nr:hypothetical protein GQ42DRAFT_29337 [Ramicandelaber brevisporus]